MNKIKNSFSKIKASDEFKERLAKELMNNSYQLKIPKKNYYYRPAIAAASLLFLIGIMSFKLITNYSEKNKSNLNNIAYIPTEDSQTTGDIIDDSFKPEDNKLPIDSVKESNEQNKLNDGNHIEDTNTNNKNENANTKDIISNSSNNVTVPEKEVFEEKTPLRNDSLNDVQAIDANNDASNNLMAFASNSRAYNGVFIPKIELPSSNELTTAKMIPLIVYKGNVYTYSPIEISSKNINTLLGRKLGTTKNTINEWSSQEDYSNELASNIGITDVYSVNGYDDTFRIMTNIKTADGKNYHEYYECLNGISIQNGGNFFEKLKLKDNISQAKFQSFTDWNNGTGTFYTINDSNLLDSLVNQLYLSIPYLPEDIENTLGDYRNDEDCKQIFLDLKDGSKNITLTILKSGYVYYGYPSLYFKIDDNFTAELWGKLGIMRIN